MTATGARNDDRGLGFLHLSSEPPDDIADPLGCHGKDTVRFSVFYRRFNGPLQGRIQKISRQLALRTYHKLLDKTTPDRLPHVFRQEDWILAALRSLSQGLQ